MHFRSYGLLLTGVNIQVLTRRGDLKNRSSILLIRDLKKVLKKEENSMVHSPYTFMNDRIKIFFHQDREWINGRTP